MFRSSLKKDLAANLQYDYLLLYYVQNNYYSIVIANREFCVRRVEGKNIFIFNIIHFFFYRVFYIIAVGSLFKSEYFSKRRDVSNFILLCTKHYAR